MSTIWLDSVLCLTLENEAQLNLALLRMGVGAASRRGKRQLGLERGIVPALPTLAPATLNLHSSVSLE